MIETYGPLGLKLRRVLCFRTRLGSRRCTLMVKITAPDGRLRCEAAIARAYVGMSEREREGPGPDRDGALESTMAGLASGTALLDPCCVCGLSFLCRDPI